MAVAAKAMRRLPARWLSSTARLRKVRPGVSKPQPLATQTTATASMPPSITGASRARARAIGARQATQQIKPSAP